MNGAFDRFVTARLRPMPHTWARLAIAIVAMGAAIHDNDGTLAEAALAWLTLGIVYAFFALTRTDEAPERQDGVVITAALTLSGALFLRSGVANVLLPHQYPVFVLISAAMLATGVAICLIDERYVPRAFDLLLVLAAANGLWLMTQLLMPGLDALQFQRESAAELLRGGNPYAMTYADPYSPDESAQFYGRGISVNGRLQFGNPYMPLTTFLSLLGQVAGDVRYASGLAVLAASWLLAHGTRSRAGYLAGALLLLSPAFPDMAVFGWSDAYVVLLLSATWFCQRRAPRLLPYMAGLFFASKQYTIVLAPAVLLLVDRPWRWRQLLPFALRATAAACIVTLPLVLWNVPAFLNSAVLLQFRQPFRADALSYMAWLQPASPERFILLPFALCALTWIAIFWQHRRRAVSFPLALALVFVVFFAFNKQAFINYYFLVTACLCAALAAEGSDAVTVTAAR